MSCHDSVTDIIYSPWLLFTFPPSQTRSIFWFMHCLWRRRHFNLFPKCFSHLSYLPNFWPMCFIFKNVSKCHVLPTQWLGRKLRLEREYIYLNTTRLRDPKGKTGHYRFLEFLKSFHEGKTTSNANVFVADFLFKMFFLTMIQIQIQIYSYDKAICACVVLITVG